MHLVCVGLSCSPSPKECPLKALTNMIGVADSTAYKVGFAFGAIVGALVVGALLGLIPLVLGQQLKQTTLGRSGFLACVVAGLILGAIAALPTCIGFCIAIWVRSRKGTA